jgi:endonuclease-8
MIAGRVPEGDTILWAATRMRPVLEGHVPEQITMPAPRPGALRGLPEHARWPARLSGRRIEAIETLGKNLLVRFEGGLLLRSHLRMTGAWAVYERGRRWRRAPSRAWIVIGRGDREVVQFDGPVLELMSAHRARHHEQLSRLGPDVLGASFDGERFLARLRADDPNRPIADALLDQRTVAGIGNIWKSEGCWEARIDPWRPVREVSDGQALAIIDGVRPRMLRSGTLGPRHADEQVYGRARRPCRRCGEPIRVLAQGDGARLTDWCPRSQR